jgi:hypothetical protein
MSNPVPGFAVADFTGINPEVVAAIADLLPDSMSTDDLAAELIRRFEAGKIEPSLTIDMAHAFALELKLRARKHRDRIEAPPPAHVYRCAGPCALGSCSLGTDCRCREFDQAPMEPGSIVHESLQHDGCGCVIVSEKPTT